MNGGMGVNSNLNTPLSLLTNTASWNSGGKGGRSTHRTANLHESHIGLPSDK